MAEKKKKIDLKIVGRVITLIIFGIGALALLAGFIGLTIALVIWAFKVLVWLGLLIVGGIVMLIGFFGALYLRDE